MIKEHFNFLTSGGIPMNAKDRYWSQDQIRDFWFLYEKSGLALRGAFGSLYNKIIVTGGVVSPAGSSPQTKVDVSRCIGYCKYSVKIPDSFASIPPTLKDVDVDMIRVDTLVNQVNIPVATLNGTSINWVKLRYKDNPSKSRTKTRDVATYNYEYDTGFEIVCDTVAPTDYDIVLAGVIGNGIGNVAVYTVSPNGGRDYEVGSIRHNVPRIISSTIAMNANDLGTLVFCVASSVGDITITPPSAFDLRWKSQELQFIRTNILSNAILIPTSQGTVSLNRVGDRVTIVSDGANWLIKSTSLVQMDTGWIQRGQWNGVKLGGVQIIFTVAPSFNVGETITESVSGNTAVVMSIQASTVYVEKVTGTGVFTATRTMTGSVSGYVGTISANTLNVDTDLTHWFHTGLTNLALNIVVSATAPPNSNTASSLFGIGIERDGGGRYGLSCSYQNANQITVRTGASGLQTLDATGASLQYNGANTFYYRIIAMLNSAM